MTDIKYQVSGAPSLDIPFNQQENKQRFLPQPQQCFVNINTNKQFKIIKFVWRSLKVIHVFVRIK